jgi:flagella basal body P-ring formation protein FlgA
MNWILAQLHPCVALTCLALGPAASGVAADPVAPAWRPAEATPPASPVTRPPRRLEEDELRNLLTDSLNASAGHSANGNEWELHFTRPWTPVKVPDEPLQVEILEPALNHITSTAVLRFELRAGRQLVGAWQLPVQARLWRAVVVAETALQRGQLLSDAPVTHVRRDVLMLREPLYELPATATAYELTESVPVGATLTPRALRLKPVVYRGQTVNAIMHDTALTISLKVEVMKEGVPGQLVRVRNLQSRRELRGKVQDEQTIAISL